MSFQSISQVLPDPFTLTPNNAIVPLTDIIHVSSAATLSGSITYPTQQQPAIKFVPSVGLFGAPIIIPNGLVNAVIIDAIIIPGGFASVTDNYFQLPTLRDLIGIWGGTYANDAVVIPGGSFMPLRQNNSWNQVQVGDVFSVPLFNFVSSSVFIPGQGSVISSSNINQYTFDVSYNTYGTLPSNASPNDTLLDGLLLTTAGTNIYQQLIFIINELPSLSNPAGKYTVSSSTMF